MLFQVRLKCKRSPMVLAVFLMLIVNAGCPKPDAGTVERGAGQPTIAVTNLPLKQMTEMIAGDGYRVVLPIPHEEDPAFWTPEPDAVESMQGADLIVINGASYETWLPTVTLPEFRLIDTSAGFRDRLIVLESAITHSHGPAGEHTHAGMVGTTWIDFDQAHQQAAAILAALKTKWPESAATFDANFAELSRQIRELDESMKQVAAKMKDHPLIVSHPIYDYWTRRYELNVRSVHWEADEVPEEEQLTELNQLLEDHPAKFMIWEAEPDPESVKILDGMGIRSVVFDLLPNGTEDDNWLEQMKTNIEQLKAVFGN